MTMFDLWSVEFGYVKAFGVVVSWRGTFLPVLQIGKPSACHEMFLSTDNLVMSEMH
jgi:hypothetical protein